MGSFSAVHGEEFAFTSSASDHIACACQETGGALCLFPFAMILAEEQEFLLLLY